MAVVLHPGMKLKYFRDHQWEEDWIKQAEILVREEYHTKYEKETSFTVEFNRKKPTPGSQSFGTLSITTRARVSELQRYLRSPTVNVEEEGLLKWWTKNKDAYLNLHRMALDYLSIPGLSSYDFIYLLLTMYLATSVAVKRIFLQCRRISQFTRNDISSFSIQASFCLGSWLRCGIIGFDDVLSAVSGTKMPSMAGSEKFSSLLCP